jgi:hypothetical protein
MIEHHSEFAALRGNQFVTPAKLVLFSKSTASNCRQIHWYFAATLIWGEKPRNAHNMAVQAMAVCEQSSIDRVISSSGYGSDGESSGPAYAVALTGVRGVQSIQDAYAISPGADCARNATTST